MARESVLFIPDINKWRKWELNIIEEIAKVNYAFVDATSHDNEEIPDRNIEEVPYSFIIESMELFQSLPLSEKQKIHFIHFNHTNAVIDTTSQQAEFVLKQGYRIAQVYDAIEL